MLIGLHRDIGNPDCIADHWAEILEAQGVDIRWVDLTAHDPFTQVKGCGGVMWCHSGRLADKLKAYRILHSIELHLGIPVYPDHYMSWHHGEKIAQHYMLKAARIPTPNTWIFWNKEEAIQWANQTDYPKIFKLSTGNMGQNVVKVDSSKEARGLIERMFSIGIYQGSVHKKQVSPILRARRLVGRYKQGIRHTLTGEPVGVSRSMNVILEKGYAYFQEFIPHEFETRISIVGDSAWAWRYRLSPPPVENAYEPSEIAINCVRMAFDITQRHGFRSMAIDFLIYHGEPMVLEMNYNHHWQLPENRFPGRWNRNLEWIEGYRSYRESEVETFLERIRYGPKSNPIKQFRKTVL